jgi:hypothetical protein
MEIVELIFEIGHRLGLRIYERFVESAQRFFVYLLLA